MAKTKKAAVLGLSNASVDKKLAKSKHVLSSMKNNSDFPNAGILLSKLQSSSDELDNLMEERSRIETVLRTINEQIIAKSDENYADLGAIVNHVNIEANGDAAKIRSSGLDFAKPITKYGALPPVLNVVLREGLGGGQIIVSNNVLKGASSYVIQITTNVLDETSWKQADVSLKSRGNVLSDLKSGTQIWVRVAGVGSKGQGAWSDVATRFVP